MKIAFAFAVVLFVSITADAQRCESGAIYPRNGKDAAGFYGLLLPSSRKECTPKQYTGQIVHIAYDEETGTAIQGFALLGSDRIRRYIDISQDAEPCLTEMVNVDRSWLPYIIRKGNRVRVDAFLCGSGGFINANNITIVTASRRERR